MYLITSINNASLLFGPCPDINISLEENVNSYKNKGVELIVSLLEEHEQVALNLEDEEKFCKMMGLDFYSLPIPDMSIPSLSRFTEALDYLHERTCDKKMIYIHCRHGIGRSSLVTAGLMIRNGMPLDFTLKLIAQKRGLEVPETLSQKKLLWAYEKFLNKMK